MKMPKIKFDQAPQGTLDQYKEIIAQAKELRKKSLEMGMAAFIEGARGLFAANPDLRGFSWEQYTPHFCDGDPCRFQFGEVHVNGYDEQEDDGKDDYVTRTTGLTYDRKRELDKAVWGLIREFERDDMEDIFGDGVSVHVTPEGLTTEHYDCGY